MSAIWADQSCSASASCGNWVDNGIKCGIEVQLFKNTAGSGLIGSILYGHTRYRQAYLVNNLVINNYGTVKWSRDLANIPPVPAPYNWSCYGGPHSHMQVKGTGVTRATTFACCNWASAGSTAVFNWTQ